MRLQSPFFFLPQWLVTAVMDLSPRQRQPPMLSFVQASIWTHVYIECDVASQHHYIDVILGAVVSETTSVSIVYSTVSSGADQRKIKAPHCWWPAIFPYKESVTQKMFPFDDVHVTFLLFPNHTACTDRYADHISHKGGWINLDNKICRHHQSLSDMWYHALISCGGWFIITGIYFKDFTLYVPCGDWNDKQMNIWFTQLWNN